jgi:hypothetical protein
VLGLFKQNTISTAAALVIVTFLMKVRAILHPPPIQELADFNKGLFFKWDWMKNFYTSSPSLYIFLSVCFLLAFALYLNFVVNNEKLFSRKSYLPALSFVLITSMLPSLNVFSFEMIASGFLFLAVSKALSLAHTTTPRKVSFDIGLFLGLASLFYFPSVFFFFLLLILLFIFRPFVLQEVLAYFLGCLTPFYFSAALLFISGQWKQRLASIYLHLHLPLNLVKFPVFVVMTLSSVILLFYSLYLINKTATKNAMVVRKKWNAIVIYYVFATIIGSLSIVFPSTAWILSITPFSIILCSTFHHNLEKFNNFTFYFLIAVLITVQWLV